MRFRAHLAQGVVSAHRGAHHQSEHPAAFVVEFFLACPAVTQTLKIRICEGILGVHIARTGEKAVRPGAEFEIKTVCNGFVRVVGTAPV